MDKWKAAQSPNYATNKDKMYSYSELPFQEYKQVKIPLCLKNLIEHVDYLGHGRVELPSGTIGFSDCYNVCDEYRLVFDGLDIGRKIPNRIPRDPKNGSTYNYIKDNSVLIVTCEEQILHKNVIRDIARIVNSERGKVIIYGYHAKNQENQEMLSEELKVMKQLFYCPIYLLPDHLQQTYWKTSYGAYLNINELKRELYRNINKGDFEAAVILTGCLSDVYCGGALGDVVNKLLANNVGNVTVYAYKLWSNGNKDVVRKHFPSVFQQIFDGNCMAIINKHNNQALVLEPKTTQAQGDGQYKSSNKRGWKIIPIWDDDNNVLFKLYNIDTDMYLQLSPTVGEDGVRQACGSKDSQELRDKFYFKPLIIMNGQVAFNIYNCEDNKQLEPLQLPVDVECSEVKAVLESKVVGSNEEGPSCWILTASSRVKEELVKKDEQTQGIDEDFCNIYDYD